MNKRTLGFKITAGGIMLVLIPILVVGGFALWKGTVALQDIAKGQAVQISKNIGEMVEVALREEMKIASQLSVQPYVVEATTKASKGGAAQATGAIEHLTAEFSKVNKQSGNEL